MFAHRIFINCFIYKSKWTVTPQPCRNCASLSEGVTQQLASPESIVSGYLWNLHYCTSYCKQTLARLYCIMSLNTIINTWPHPLLYMWDALTHPHRHINGGVIKPSLQLGHTFWGYWYIKHTYGSQSDFGNSRTLARANCWRRGRWHQVSDIIIVCYVIHMWMWCKIDIHVLFFVEFV